MYCCITNCKHACARRLGSRAAQDRKGGKRVSQQKGEGVGGGVGGAGVTPPVGATDRRDPPRHRFAAPPSDWGGSHRAAGGGGGGGPIRVCLLQTLLGRKPRRITVDRLHAVDIGFDQVSWFAELPESFQETDPNALELDRFGSNRSPNILMTHA